MAKKNDNIDQPVSKVDSNDFASYTTSLPDVEKQFLEGMGINSLEDLQRTLILMGIDPDKALEQAGKAQSFDDFAESDIMLDKDDPRILFHKILMDEDRGE